MRPRGVENNLKVKKSGASTGSSKINCAVCLFGESVLAHVTDKCHPTNNRTQHWAKEKAHIGAQFSTLLNSMHSHEAGMPLQRLISSPQASSLWKRSSRSFLRGARGGHRVVNLTGSLAGSLTSRGKFFFVNYGASYIYLFSVDLTDFDICSSPTPKKTNRCGDDRLHPLSFCL